MIVKVLIRQATLKDLPELQRLGTELMVSERRFEPLFEERWYYSDAGTRFLLKEIKGRGRICLLAEINDRAVGYAACKWIPNDTARPIKVAELAELVVSPQHRSHGIGHQLMAEFKTWAKNKGAQRLKVVVNARNKDAIRFYRDCGFDDYLHTLEANLSE